MPVCTDPIPKYCIVKPVALPSVINPDADCNPKFKAPLFVVKVLSNDTTSPTFHPPTGFTPPLLLSKDTVVAVVLITAPT